MNSSNKKIGIIAGSGELPKQLIKACQEDKREYFIVALDNTTEEETVKNTPHSWIHIGKVSGIIKELKKQNVTDVLLAGRVGRPSPSSLNLDFGGLKLLIKLSKLDSKGDDKIFSTIIKYIEGFGFDVIGAEEILENLLIKKEVLGEETPDEVSLNDISIGTKAALAIGDLDIGQAVIVQQGQILGVEGPEVEDSTSLLLSFKDAERNNIVEMIVGKLRLSSASQSTPGLYIRKPDDKQSYLVDGVVDITSSKTDWIERTLFDIPAEAIRAVRVEHTDGDTYTLFKNEKGQERFSLENLPSGKKLASELIISRYGSILQDIQINGARSKEKLQKPENSINVLIHTFEGTVIELVAFEHDDIPYGSFEFRFDESLLVGDEDQEKIDGVKAYVSNMNAQTLNWWYEIPPFKYDVIKKRSDSIMRNDKSSAKSD